MKIALIGVVLFAASVLWMARSWHRRWWNERWVRLALVGLASASIGGNLLRMWVGRGPGAHAPSLAIPLTLIVGTSSVMLFALFLTLPLAALLRRVIARLSRAPAVASAPESAPSLRAPSRETRETVVGPSPSPPEVAETPDAEAAPVPAQPAQAEPARPSAPRLDSELVPAPAHGGAPALAGPRLVLTRRELTELAVASLPIAALATAGLGVTNAFQGTQIVERRMRFAGLPPGLEGLRILQFTDLHLGAYLDPEGVREIVERAREHRPDLVVLTGDIIDHVPWLAPTLAAVKSLDAPLGCYAVMGNHEHYRGARETRLVYARSGVELLDDRSQLVDVRGAKLVIAGVDDPARRGKGDFYQRAIDRALESTPSEAFRLGLCHRPSGFPTLASRGVDLTLSGHTHGAQLGTPSGRSLLEPIAPEAYLWGRYRLGDKQLYTSSGGGHWFAFRLACPSEAALVVLERGEPGDDTKLG